MEFCEYLVRFGRLGDFGRFRAEPAFPCARGDRVVVRTARGLEVGEVLCDAGEGHIPFLPNSTVGALVRPASITDDARIVETQTVAQAMLARAVELATTLGMPLEFLDAETTLDGRHAILHLLRLGECDVRDLVSALAGEFDRTIELADLGEVPAQAPAEEKGCGSCGSGGCGSGGCGSCSSGETREQFAALREKMEQRHPLL